MTVLDPALAAMPEHPMSKKDISKTMRMLRRQNVPPETRALVETILKADDWRGAANTHLATVPVGVRDQVRNVIATIQASLDDDA